MKTDDKVLNVIESGISPLSLAFTDTIGFDGKPPILRSTLLINSLSVGVLRFDQYRYIIGRNKRGAELFSRHAEKVFEWMLGTQRKIRGVTLPVLSSTLLSGAATKILFNTFAKYPGVGAEKVYVEVSADVLYEDNASVKNSIGELSALGVKVAAFEVGHEYCPLMRLSELHARCCFVDRFAIKDITANDEAASGLPAMLHSGGAEVYAPVLTDEGEIAAVKAAGYDGYLSDSEVIENV